MGENSWIIDNLNAALNTWNGKLAEIWQLLTQSPEDFKGGGVWTVMLNVHSAMTAIGLGLLVLFFAVGVVKTCGSFAEARRPEQALKLFLRFVLAKAAVQYGLELMLAVFDIVQGIVSRAMGAAGTGGLAPTTLPQEIVDKINAVGGNAAGRAVHHGAVFCDDHDGVRACVPLVFLCRAGAHPSGHICGRTNKQCGPQLCEKLCGRMFGGCGDRAGMHHLFRNGFRTACRGQQCFRSYGSLELCGGAFV